MTPRESIEHMVTKTIAQKYKMGIVISWEKFPEMAEDVIGPDNFSEVMALTKRGSAFFQFVGFTADEINNEKYYLLNRSDIISRFERAIRGTGATRAALCAL